MDALGALLTPADGLGSSPGTLGGILIIVGIVVALAAAGFLLHLLLHKGFLRSRGTPGREEEHPPGRVGRL
jgi:hypothetical protein